MNIHDNQILNYTIDIKNKTLLLNTITEQDKTCNIKFTGLMAHHFENVISCNIILDINEIDIATAVDDRCFDEGLKYGFPCLEVSTIEQLKIKLINEDYKMFVIYASLGLNGYIIAKSMEIN